MKSNHPLPHPPTVTIIPNYSYQSRLNLILLMQWMPFRAKLNAAKICDSVLSFKWTFLF